MEWFRYLRSRPPYPNSPRRSAGSRRRSGAPLRPRRRKTRPTRSFGRRRLPSGDRSPHSHSRSPARHSGGWSNIRPRNADRIPVRYTGRAARGTRQRLMDRGLPAPVPSDSTVSGRRMVHLGGATRAHRPRCKHAAPLHRRSCARSLPEETHRSGFRCAASQPARPPDAARNPWHSVRARNWSAPAANRAGELPSGSEHAYHEIRGNGTHCSGSRGSSLTTHLEALVSQTGAATPTGSLNTRTWPCRVEPSSEGSTRQGDRFDLTVSRRRRPTRIRSSVAHGE